MPGFPGSGVTGVPGPWGRPLRASSAVPDFLATPRNIRPMQHSTRHESFAAERLVRGVLTLAKADATCDELPFAAEVPQSLERPVTRVERRASEAVVLRAG